MAISILAWILIMIFVPGNVFAHKVNIFAYVEDGKVYTESYFNDGKEVVDSKVEVLDSRNNELLLTGETDKEGKFSFNITEPAGLRIVLTASMGHKNEYLLSEKEVRESLGMAKGSDIKIRKNLGKPSIRDIFAGIGYIFGLMGIGIYFKYKFKRPTTSD